MYFATLITFFKQHELDVYDADGENDDFRDEIENNCLTFRDDEWHMPTGEERIDSEDLTFAFNNKAELLQKLEKAKQTVDDEQFGIKYFKLSVSPDVEKLTLTPYHELDIVDHFYNNRNTTFELDDNFRSKEFDDYLSTLKPTEVLGKHIFSLLVSDSGHISVGGFMIQTDKDMNALMELSKQYLLTEFEKLDDIELLCLKIHTDDFLDNSDYVFKKFIYETQTFEPWILGGDDDTLGVSLIDLLANATEFTKV